MAIFPLMFFVFLCLWLKAYYALIPLTLFAVGRLVNTHIVTKQVSHHGSE